MKTHLINNANSKDLMIFLLGWGMDYLPMVPVVGERNVLFVYDYTDLKLEFDFSKYKKFTLAAFSCGVFMAPFLKEKLPTVSKATAFSGVFELFNPEFGLTPEVISVFKGITLDNYMDFRRDYLLDTQSELEKFNKHAPLRTIESSLAELDALERYDKTFPKTGYPFSRVFIGKNDRIIPAKNQEKAWKDLKPEIVEGGHFLFYNHGNLDFFFN